MALKLDIPQINITPEAEEDDDHSPYNISDTLTDVEDLNDDDDNKPYEKKKNKLMIKLMGNEALTDLEDFEGSEEEKDVTVFKHEKPLDVDKVLEDSAFEEIHSNQGDKKGNISSSNTLQCLSKDHCLEFTDEIELDLSTDSENYDTETDVEVAIPENTVNLDLLKSDEDYVLDNIKPNDKSLGDHFANDYLSIRSVSPCVSELTDVEIVQSNSSGDEKAVKRTKNRRRRHRSHKKLNTNLEDIKLSTLKRVEREKKTHKPVGRDTSVPYDSENEGENIIPFPVTKKVFKKNQPYMQIPEFDTNILTETEDFGDQIDPCEVESNLNIDESAFEEKLDEMASCYSQVKESNIVNSLCLLNQVAGIPDIDIQGEHTDVDDFQTDTDGDIEPLPREDSVSFNIKFSPSMPNFDTALNQPNSLILPNNTEDPLTDLENIESSPDVSEHRQMRIALLNQQCGTEIEEFALSDSDFECDNIPEIRLPPVTRNLMIIEENASLIPTVRIMPLPNDDDELSEAEQNLVTDEESVSEVSEAEDALNYLDVEKIVRSPTPDLPALEGGQISVVENINRSNKINENDDMTDTEEIYFESKQKKKRPPKFKHMYQKGLLQKNNALGIEDQYQPLTDTEDIYFSDYKKEPLIVPALNTSQVLTDTENLEFSEDDRSIRAFSTTPEHMRQLEDNALFFKEGSGPFSIIDKLEINRFAPNKPVYSGTPLPTDTEEILVSAEEDNDYSRSNTATPNQIHEELDNMSSTKVHNEITKKFDEEAEVMYLRGGGYCDRQTDVEEFYESSELDDNSPNPYYV